MESVPAYLNSLSLEVFDTGLAGNGTVDITVTSISDTSGETVTLSESSSGQFLGSVDLNHGTFRIIENIDDYTNDVEQRLAELMQNNNLDRDEESIQLIRDQAKHEIYLSLIHI